MPAPQLTQLFAPPEPTSSARSRVDGIPAPATPGISILAAVASDQAPSANTSGTITVDIPSLIDVDRRPVDILADELKSTLFRTRGSNRLRSSAVLLHSEGPAGQKEHENPAVSRLLAIAIFGAWTDTLE